MLTLTWTALFALGYLFALIRERGRCQLHKKRELAYWMSDQEWADFLREEHPDQYRLWIREREGSVS